MRVSSFSCLTKEWFKLLINFLAACQLWIVSTVRFLVFGNVELVVPKQPQVIFLFEINLKFFSPQFTILVYCKNIQIMIKYSQNVADLSRFLLTKFSFLL